MRPLIVFCLALGVSVGACGGAGDTTTTSVPTGLTSEAVSTTEAEPATAGLSELAAADIELLRELALGYWDAFNAYDVDAVLAYLEADYRSEREEEIQSDIDRLSTFGVRLGIEEEAPPTSIGAGEAEMFLSLKEPLGTRRIRMAFTQVDGEWKISFAEEVED